MISERETDSMRRRRKRNT